MGVQSLFLLAPFHLTVLTCARLSLTCLYRRIFAVPRFRTAAFAADAVTISWYISGLGVNIFSCTPVDFFWKPLGHGTCIPYSTYILAHETMGILLDVAILVLPVRMIMGLQMAIRTRFLLSGIFLLGGL